MARPLREIPDPQRIPMRGTVFGDGRDKYGATHFQGSVNEEFGISLGASCSNRKWTTTITTEETGDREFTPSEFAAFLDEIKAETEGGQS